MKKNILLVFVAFNLVFAMDKDKKENCIVRVFYDNYVAYIQTYVDCSGKEVRKYSGDVIEVYDIKPDGRRFQIIKKNKQGNIIQEKHEFEKLLNAFNKKYLKN